MTRTDSTLPALRSALVGRRQLLAALGGAAAAAATNDRAFVQGPPADGSDDLAATARLLDLPFTEAQCDQAEPSLGRQRRELQLLRGVDVPWDGAPAFSFDPVAFARAERPRHEAADEVPDSAPLGDSDADLAFATVRQLGDALRSGRTTSRRLTTLALERLERHDPLLKCVVTLLRDEALAAAERADRELAAGRDRGPLHGIPYGAKDLFAWPGAPTTFGAAPFAAQDLGTAKATVLRLLEDAGAVLCAKLSLGALAMGDVWFGGRTRNPWNPERGSSGSSAGSASAVAAGLLPFALGTETNGSILSPSSRCGVSAVRPTFGRISRSGAMPLSWTMDKVGVLARGAEDAALVHAALAGFDPDDPCTRRLDGAPGLGSMSWPVVPSLRGARVGRLGGSGERWSDEAEALLKWMQGQGAELVEFEPPPAPVGAMLSAILMAEATAACDWMMRAGHLDALTRQDDSAWPNRLRVTRVLPAADYLQAMRIRSDLIAAMAERMASVDLVVGSGRGGGLLSLTNFTGHPALVLPIGKGGDGRQPGVATLFGRLDDDARLLAVGAAWQRATDWHLQRPDGFA